MPAHDAWLIKAKSDLKISHILFDVQDNSILDGTIYHVQQCAEKALKAYLVFRGAPIERTHNLVVLVRLCCNFDSSFDALKFNAITLNPYSSQFRYPDIISLPTREDVDEAIKISEKILIFVLQKAPL